MSNLSLNDKKRLQAEDNQGPFFDQGMLDYKLRFLIDNKKSFSSGYIDSPDNTELSVFKKALYKQQIPRDAIRTSLKTQTKHFILNDENELQAYLENLKKNLPNP